MMGVKIHLLILTEDTDEIGEPRLSGRFGRAMLVGRVQSTTEEGGRIWSIALAERPEQTRFRVQRYFGRKERLDDD